MDALLCKGCYAFIYGVPKPRSDPSLDQQIEERWKKRENPSPRRRASPRKRDVQYVAVPVEEDHAHHGATQAIPRGSCSLRWEECNQGTLFTDWRADTLAQEDVLAFFVPAKKVPPFKYNSPKVELVRNSAPTGPHVRRYYQGWSQFVKMCRQWDGTLVIRQAACVSVYLNFGDRITEVVRGTQYDIGMKKQPYSAAVAVTSQNNTCLEGLLQMPIARFLDQGNQAGAALPLDRQS